VTTEYVLILGLFAFLLMGAFTRPSSTFKDAGPRFAAKLERDIAVGKKFKIKDSGGKPHINWSDPSQNAGP
jgi:hypothetical protein